MKWSHHFWVIKNIFQCIEGALLYSVYSVPELYLLRIVYHLASFVKMAAFWVEMGVAYLEMYKHPCLLEIDIPMCIRYIEQNLA